MNLTIILNILGILALVALWGYFFLTVFNTKSSNSASDLSSSDGYSGSDGGSCGGDGGGCGGD